MQSQYRKANLEKWVVSCGMRTGATSLCKLLATGISAFLASAFFACGAVVYVSPAGSHSFPYASWADAATNIADAVVIARNGDTIRVGDGTYYLAQQILITNAVTIIGENGAAATIVDGNLQERCFYIEHSDAVLDGLTIQNGWAEDEGGGVYLREGGTVQNCVIVSNRAPYGGGAFCYYGGLIRDSVLMHNLAMTTNVNPSGPGNFFKGGGVHCHEGGVVQDCMIVSNAATHEYSPTGTTYYSYGGGVYSRHHGTVQNCVVEGNRAVANNIASGGGVYLQEGSDLRNCVIAGNLARADNSPNPAGDGGGVYLNLTGRGGSVESCTIVGNTAFGEHSGAGGGIYNFRSTNSVRNTIVYFNSAITGDNISNNNDDFQYDYCCTTPAISGTGNITGNPLFVGGAAGNYRLLAASPCIDAGDNTSAPPFDLDCNDRPLDGTGSGTARTDIGAYEYTADRLEAPAGVSATDGMYHDRVTVTWNAVSGASLYDVWRGTDDNYMTAERIAENIATTYYADTNTVPWQVYYYWVKVKTSAFSASDSGYASEIGPIIRANGMRQTLRIRQGMPVSITVELVVGSYAGALADCWVVAVPRAGAWWYFLDAARVWTPFAAGDFTACQPVYAGPVGYVPATTVLDRHELARGIYDFYFAVDAMDGLLDTSTPFRDVVTVTVE